MNFSLHNVIKGVYWTNIKVRTVRTGLHSEHVKKERLFEEKTGESFG